MTKNKVFIFIGTLFLLMPVTATAQSGGHADPSSLSAMQKQLDALSNQVENLTAIVETQSKVLNEQQKIIDKQTKELAAREKRKKTGASSALATAPHMENEEKQALAKITMAPGPKIEKTGSPYSFQPFGRVHLDATHFEDDRKDHPGNTNFRRARLGFKGALGEDINYVAEFDFAKEDVAFKNVSLTYAGFDPVDLKIGHFKPALGFDNNTSSNYIPFIERSSVNNAFARGELIGAGFSTNGTGWALSGGIFGEDAGSTSTADDEDISADLRGAYHIGTARDGLLHFGLGGSWRNPSGTVKFAAKPTGIGDNMVDTGNIGAVDTVTVGGIETAAIWGPLSFQGEYLYTHIDRHSADSAAFDGYYLQAGYFLTGESRPYKKSSGYFNRVKPLRPFRPAAGDWGAFELTGRYDTLDLNDAGAGITGGTMKNYTIGMNWHLTDHIRFMGNIIAVNTDNNAVTPDDDPTIFNIRTQWDF